MTREELPQAAQDFVFAFRPNADSLSMLYGGHLYLVGSALTSPNWRDVDIRVILDDDAYDDLARNVVPAILNLSISVWGRKVTGLPIDFQIQRMTDANAEFSGRRNALGMIGEATP